MEADVLELQPDKPSSTEEEENSSQTAPDAPSETPPSDSSDTSSITQSEAQGGLQLEFMKLDLNSLKSVEKFADAFKSKYTQLNVLICNAGIAGVPQGWFPEL